MQNIMRNGIELHYKQWSRGSKEKKKAQAYVYASMGERETKANIKPETIPAAGRVATHPAKTPSKRRQLRDLNPPPDMRPMAEVAPVMQWVDETGRPILEQVKMVIEVPISAEKPRVGDM